MAKVYVFNDNGIYRELSKRTFDIMVDTCVTGGLEYDVIKHDNGICELSIGKKEDVEND